MLRVGHILIPSEPYLYCLRVDRLQNIEDLDEYEWSVMKDFPLFTNSTRYDLDHDTREPVFQHGSKYHCIHIRELGPDVYQSDEGWGEKVDLVTWRRWIPPQGELF